MKMNSPGSFTAACLSGLTILMITGCIRKSSQGDLRESQAPDIATRWLTNTDRSALLQKEPVQSAPASDTARYPVITIQEDQTYQSVYGFGYALTDGSAIVINRMDPGARSALLKELFDTSGTDIGVSYLRISIGASDLSDHVYSYDDLPAGQTDTGMVKFSLDPARHDLIPVLKEILAINPHIRILGSPWSPPVWMKTNHSSKGGSLDPAYYDAYARYFVKYVRGMEAAGIPIDAITIQNEPLNPDNNPSMVMQADEQAAFIKQSLGPAFRAAGIHTRIILYDHNADRPDYPLSILADPEARQYVDGSAFHLYAGNIDTLTLVHEAYPDKDLYFTEQWVGAPGDFAADLDWHVRTLIIGATRNWCRVVLEWNLAATPELTPHTEGGCTQCLGAITVDGNKVTRNPAYYIVAHASKFVRPGSVRLASDLPPALPNVAFKTPEGHTVLIVENDSASPQAFLIRDGDTLLSTKLKGGSVATYVW